MEKNHMRLLTFLCFLAFNFCVPTQFVVAKLDEGYVKLAASDSKSLLKKYLTKEVLDNLKNKKTPTFAVNEIEKRIPFSFDDRLDFVSLYPTNVSTAIRASVHIKLPKLAANLAKLEEVAGEHTEAEGGIYDTSISNKRRMGVSEYQAVKEM